jgi:Fe-S-cluster containining protein
LRDVGTPSVNAAVEAELARLCGSCGLCCDGSLFGRVDLEPDEVEPAKRGRLRVLRSEKGFEQPCAALSPSEHGLAERHCSVYEDRPRSCRRFTCRLYERHRRDGGSVEERLAVVRRVRLLVARLEASGLTPADLEDAVSGVRPIDGEADLARDYRELTRSLEEDFARAP